MRRNWDELRQRAANSVHGLAVDVQGQPNGSYQSPMGGTVSPVRVIKTRQLVNPVGYDAIAEEQTVVRLIKSEVNAESNGRVMIDDQVYVLVAVLEDNGVRQTWQVRPR